MSWSLDPPVHLPGLTVAAIVETEVSVHGVAGLLAGHGGKRPRLLLLRRDGRVWGLDLAGRRLAGAERLARGLRAGGSDAET